MSLQIGEVFSGSGGVYEVVKKVGEGGFGAAFLVIEKNSNTEVIAKVPIKFTATVLKSFEGEFRVLKDLENLQVPNVVRARELVNFNDGRNSYPILILDKAQGNTLTEIITNGGIDFSDCSDILSKLSNAVKLIHRAGYMHLDIAPDNIFIDDFGGNNTLTIIDFGISAQKSDTSTYAITSHVVSGVKKFYGAPEQNQGNPSQGSDIFSIGATGFGLLLGLDKMLGILHSTPAPPYDLGNFFPNQTISADQIHLHGVILKSTWPERKGRFATAEDLENALAGKEPDENYPRLIVNGNTHLLTGHGPWTIGREDKLDKTNNPDIIIQEKSPTNPYISRSQARIERRSEDGTLILYHTGMNDTRVKISRGSSVRWNKIGANGYPIGSKYQVICFGYADHPSSNAIDKDGNPVAPGPYQQLEFWPPTAE